MRPVIALLLAVCFVPAVAAITAPAEPASLVEELSALSARLPDPRDANRPLARMLERDADAGLRAANHRETEAWRQIRSREDWEAYRDLRVAALRDSLGLAAPPPARAPRVLVTGRLSGEGHRVENLVFESRPGLFVTANLYHPADDPASMPGVLLCHSHHAPKSDGELQDLAIHLARNGCTVLVMDLLGHGERRQHPFASAGDYPGPFKVGRQDYYFRYNVGMQLQLVGQSLIGWVAGDLMRGIDLLLARPGVDKDRIVLLGSVAGGGDLAAVTAALDPRVAAVAAFNFGGPQPETPYPLPDDVGETFDYAGGGSWESTRNLPRSARDGFLPWVIVGSVAPRRLIYGHEFSWDEPHDPVWARLQRIYGFYDARPNLAGAHGRGRLSGRPPEASHCNNIGPVQLEGVLAALEAWFRIPRRDFEARRQRRDAAALTCMTADAVRELSPKSVWELASEKADASIEARRRERSALPPEARRQRVRAAWRKVLGDIDPPAQLAADAADPSRGAPPGAGGGKVLCSRVALHVEADVVVPVLIFRPVDAPGRRLPVVVGFAQDGSRGFLKRRASSIAALLEGGTAFCLADLRGTGETAPAPSSRGRTSDATALSASYLMLGRPLLGQRLRDLRCVLQYLHGQDALDAERFALWGDSPAAPNPPDRRTDVPFDTDPFPAQSEPMGETVALLGGLFEPTVRAVYAHGGLRGYRSVLGSPFCYLPHDAIVPGVLGDLDAADLCDVAATFSPRPLYLTGLVDGRNRLLGPDDLRRAYAPASDAYRAAGAAAGLGIDADERPEATAAWLAEQLRR